MAWGQSPPRGFGRCRGHRPRRGKRRRGRPDCTRSRIEAGPAKGPWPGACPRDMAATDASHFGRGLRHPPSLTADRPARRGGRKPQRRGARVVHRATRSSAEWISRAASLRVELRREEPVRDGAERRTEPVRVGEPSGCRSAPALAAGLLLGDERGDGRSQRAARQSGGARAAAAPRSARARSRPRRAARRGPTQAPAPPKSPGSTRQVDQPPRRAAGITVAPRRRADHRRRHRRPEQRLDQLDGEAWSIDCAEAPAPRRRPEAGPSWDRGEQRLDLRDQPRARARNDASRSISGAALTSALSAIAGIDACPLRPLHQDAETAAVIFSAVAQRYSVRPASSTRLARRPR